MTKPYVYSVFDPITGKYYIGSRYKKYCDFDSDTYYGSSSNATYQEIVNTRPQTLVKTLIAVGSEEDIKSLEYCILKSIPKSERKNYFNCHFGWSSTPRITSESHPDVVTARAKKVSDALRGRKQSQEHSDKSRAALLKVDKTKRADAARKGNRTPEARKNKSNAAKLWNSIPENREIKSNNSRNQMRLRKLAADYYGVHYFDSSPYVKKYIAEVLNGST